jgi:hypothetical protein
MSELHVQYLVDADGEARNVLLPIEEFKELLECAEDVLDSAEMDRLRNEPCSSWQDVKAEAEADHGA